MSVHNFSVKDNRGNQVNLKDYKGKVLLIANTASECGFTPQYAHLEKLNQEYKEKGLEVLGFPSNQFGAQEPGDNNQIKEFCQINYGVSFKLFDKIDVRGENADPLFKYLTENTKFEGLDTSDAGGKMLNDHLVANAPEFLEGDSIKWNFTKFLIDKEGNIVKRYESPISPESIVGDIEELL